MKFVLLTSLVVVSFFWSGAASADYAFANIWHDLLLNPYSLREQPVWVPRTRMVLLDTDLIDDDFSERKATSWREKAMWMLENGNGFIAEDQLGPNIYNDLISTSPGVRLEALRPRFYGRALVYRKFEVKGAGRGADTVPKLDGLLSLRMALREFLFEKIETLYLRRLFPQMASPVVRIYGVGSLAFHLADRGLDAGNLARQLNRRKSFDRQDDNLAIEFEIALRLVGIATSIGRSPNANVQLTDDGRLVDLGCHQVFEGTFPEFGTGKNRISVTALEEFAIPFELLGRTYGTNDEFRDRALELADRWARGFVDRTLSAENVKREFDEVIAVVKERADRVPSLTTLRMLYPEKIVTSQIEPHDPAQIFMGRQVRPFAPDPCARIMGKLGKVF